MKKIVNQNFFPITAIIIIIIWTTLLRKDRVYNTYRCETKKKAINGVITKIAGRTGYMTITIDNKQRYYFDISSIKFKKGFGEFHDYEVGDSVYKQANTNEVKITRGDSICILILRCDQ